MHYDGRFAELKQLISQKMMSLLHHIAKMSLYCKSNIIVCDRPRPTWRRWLAHPFAFGVEQYQKGRKRLEILQTGEVGTLRITVTESVVPDFTHRCFRSDAPRQDLADFVHTWCILLIAGDRLLSVGLGNQTPRRHLKCRHIHLFSN